jgi:hypothetical protein
MWVQQNINLMFYYQEIGVKMDGGFIGQNMPFIMGIQTPWQREMMIEHGHQKGVVIDATFGTNEKIVDTLCLIYIHGTCTCDLIH